ncbi:MAG TPA: hypothetical protein VIM84_05775, partial [Gemmatimonadales bacterium]
MVETDYIWAVIPFIDLPDLTIQACEDCLAQNVACRVLLISQGSSEETEARMREYADQHHPEVLLWTFSPALPSLSGVWNRALNFCWELGATEAWVLNNDVRLHPSTLFVLKGHLREAGSWFVSAVGVREDDWHPDSYAISGDHGGPDFSCFLISKAGHETYPFDEGFIPCYMEDCDAHRRYMLGGDGGK